MNPILKADNPDLYELVKYKQQLTARAHPHNPPIKNIVAVGALCNARGEWGISKRDTNWIKFAMQSCDNLGFEIAKDFSLQTPNFGTNRTDFLDPNVGINADLVVLCLIPTPRCSTAALRAAEAERLVVPDHVYKQSPYAHEPEIWPKAIAATGARVVVTFARPGYGLWGEISPDQIVNKDYADWGSDKVKETTHREIQEYTRSVILRRDLYNEMSKRHTAAYG